MLNKGRAHTQLESVVHALLFCFNLMIEMTHMRGWL